MGWGGQLVDLRDCADREALWHLELVHAGQQKQAADKQRRELAAQRQARKKRRSENLERPAGGKGDGYDSEEVRQSEYAMMKGELM